MESTVSSAISCLIPMVINHNNAVSMRRLDTRQEGRLHCTCFSCVCFISFKKKRKPKGLPGGQTKLHVCLFVRKESWLVYLTKSTAANKVTRDTKLILSEQMKNNGTTSDGYQNKLQPVDDRLLNKYKLIFFLPMQLFCQIRTLPLKHFIN